jgi:hypothetical protein
MRMAQWEMKCDKLAIANLYMELSNMLSYSELWKTYFIIIRRVKRQRTKSL